MREFLLRVAHEIKPSMAVETATPLTGYWLWTSTSMHFSGRILGKRLDSWAPMVSVVVAPSTAGASGDDDEKTFSFTS
jgi:hypothetical protein